MSVMAGTPKDLRLETEISSQMGFEQKRPSFSSRHTEDRLSETARRPSITSPTSVSKNGRRSVFREIGLDAIKPEQSKEFPTTHRTPEIETDTGRKSPEPKRIFKPSLPAVDEKERDGKPWYSKLGRASRPKVQTAASAPSRFTSLPRVAMIAALLAVVIPGINFHSNGRIPADGAEGGVIREPTFVENGSVIQGRADSPVDTCTRWSHQSALVNGTVWIYGGQAKTSSGQTNNTWNNNFFTLSLNSSWQISSPSFKGLPQPSGPPAVANGYLWNSYDSLFLYGGEFAENPPQSPVAMSTWEYNIGSSQWIEHSNPRTTGGNNSDPGGVAVQRSAEGAGLSVPELGLSWYFGGHQDTYTAEGWSNQIARIYLRSLLEFTHPGYMNTAVDGLRAGESGAGRDGVYRNITEGGLQDSAGFTERADGVLVYIPGWGECGILLGLAGGTEDTFTEMNEIDIYDIATSTWYKQATSGASPLIRVNPCAVVFAAPDASSFNVYLYAGQNLQPFKEQTQYTDLWILTVPSFTWIQTDLSNQSQPPARAGHTCHAYDGQIVVIGGYVGTQISCDSPGIYIFNASSLSWQNTFNTLSRLPGSQQSSQDQDDSTVGSDSDYSILAGSYGYLVPDIVQSAIGGNAYGSATATTPAAGAATAGPIATGKPPTFTITHAGSTVIQTAHSTATAPSTSPSSLPSSQPKSSPNTATIAAGVIASLLFLLALYLAFCTWLYRRQLQQYKDHVAMAQRTSLGYSHSPEFGWPREKPNPGPNAMLGAFGTEILPTPSPGQSSVGSSGRGSGVGSGLSSGPTATLAELRSARMSEDYAGGGYGGGYAAYGAGASAGMEMFGGRSSGSSKSSSTEDLLAGHEPSFISVVMSPRRTLRVINRD